MCACVRAWWACPTTLLAFCAQVLGAPTDHQRWARDAVSRMRRGSATHVHAQHHEVGGRGGGIGADSVDSTTTRLLQRIGASLLRTGHEFAARVADTASRTGAEARAAAENFGGNADGPALDTNGRARAAAIAAQGGLHGEVVALRAEHEALDVRTRQCRWCLRARDGEARLRVGDRVRVCVLIHSCRVVCPFYPAFVSRFFVSLLVGWFARFVPIR